MPRTMWVSSLCGLATAIVLSLALAIAFAPGLAAMLLIFAAGVGVFGFMGLLFGVGVGAVIYAPKWAIAGAIVACIPYACMFGYYFATAPPAALQREGPWYIGVVIFSLPATCGAGVGALLQVRHNRPQVGAAMPKRDSP
jgi:hypothetical protein